MPDLSTKLHLQMLDHARDEGTAPSTDNGEGPLYGLHWGDPEVAPPLGFVRDHFLKRFISSETVALEIGPGGGRWTRYMRGARKLIAVDYHRELLEELAKNFDLPNIEYVLNNGTDFPGVDDRAVDFIFSFGVFVHLELDIIESYLANMKRIMHEDTVVVLQYADKNKPLGKTNAGFSNNNPERMRKMVLGHGYEIVEEDTQTLWHSSIIRFALPK